MSQKSNCVMANLANNLPQKRTLKFPAIEEQMYIGESI
jgi:hypothetical protein